MYRNLSKSPSLSRQRPRGRPFCSKPHQRFYRVGILGIKLPIGPKVVPFGEYLIEF